jgi:hypothetical protein
MTPRLPEVLSPADLPMAELCAARLDGDLFAIADCFSPVDLPEQPADRARAAAQRLSERVIVERLSAAWVFGVMAAPPREHQYCSAADARAKPSTLRRLTLREVVIDEDEVVVLGGVRVTSPLRTACDLVRSAPQFDAALRLMVLRLLSLAGASIDDCVAVLDRRRNLPGKVRTLDRLRSLALPTDSAVADAVDVVNRVDSSHRIEHPVEVRGVAHFEDELAERQTVG